ncbi:hypothetical protein PENSOL_c177G11578, partial [Penicillium solitum]
AILEKYKNLFRSELPIALPPERNVAHEVETGAARPVNINTYALSAEKLDEQLEFYSYVVRNGTIRPLTAKTEALNDWPRPKNVYDIRQFVGLAIYYRRFIKDFAKICVPLYELLKESDSTLRKKRFRPIIWTEAYESAFRMIKELLISTPILKQPDRNKPYTIETDASEWALGAILM